MKTITQPTKAQVESAIKQAEAEQAKNKEAMKAIIAAKDKAKKTLSEEITGQA
jgi:hypothetical protein